MIPYRAAAAFAVALAASGGLAWVIHIGGFPQDPMDESEVLFSTAVRLNQAPWGSSLATSDGQHVAFQETLSVNPLDTSACSPSDQETNEVSVERCLDAIDAWAAGLTARLRFVNMDTFDSWTMTADGRAGTLDSALATALWGGEPLRGGVLVGPHSAIDIVNQTLSPLDFPRGFHPNAHSNGVAYDRIQTPNGTEIGAVFLDSPSEYLWTVAVPGDDSGSGMRAGVLAASSDFLLYVSDGSLIWEDRYWLLHLDERTWREVPIPGESASATPWGHRADLSESVLVILSHGPSGNHTLRVFDPVSLELLAESVDHSPRRAEILTLDSDADRWVTLSWEYPTSSQSDVLARLEWGAIAGAGGSWERLFEGYDARPPIGASWAGDDLVLWTNSDVLLVDPNSL